MIFRTFNNASNGWLNKAGIFNKSFQAIREDLRLGYGPIMSLFNNGNAANDITAIENIARAMQTGSISAQELQAHLTNCTEATRNHAMECLRNNGNLIDLARNLRLSAVAAKIQAAALNMVSMAINMIAFMVVSKIIEGIVSGIKEITQASKIASDTANELYSKSSERVENNKKEAASLKELIEKYKELKSNDSFDIETRTELRDIQYQISELIGAQASNLDLVNGKLDEELGKLQQISAEQAKDNYEDSKDNYYKAKNASKKAVGNADDYGNDFVQKFFEYKTEHNIDTDDVSYMDDNSIICDYQIAGFKDIVKLSNDSNSIVVDTRDIDNIEDKIKRLTELKAYLAKNGQEETSIYSGVISAIDNYKGYVNNEAAAATDLVDLWIANAQYSNDTLTKISVDSVGSLRKYRRQFIREAINDETISQAIQDNDLSKQDISAAINSYIATCSEFSTWYDEWKNTFKKNAIYVSFEAAFYSEDFESVAKELKELAIAGQISAESLSSTEKYKALLDATGLSAEEAYQKILDLTIAESSLSDIMSTMQSHAQLINSVNKDLSDNGKISLSTLQDITSAFPSLEKYVISYLNGSSSSFEELINLLNSFYQTDISNYQKYYSIKYDNDTEFWKEWCQKYGDGFKHLAKQYEIDYNNYTSYAQVVEDINNKLIESFNNVLTARNAVNNLTTGDITKSATVAGLSSDQKRAANEWWNKWQEQYVKGTSDISISSMTNQLIHSGFNEGIANTLATELYHTLVTYKKEDYQNLLSLKTNLIDSVEQYKATFTDNAFDSSVFDPKNFDSSTTSSNESTNETFDWIETKISNLTEELDKLKTKMDNTYTSWCSRNNALTSVISKTQEAIILQSQAYQRYMQEAESSGISSFYKNLVQNGAISIDAISDETLKNQIQSYEEWYKKAQECLKTQEDLTLSLNELNSQKFTNIQSEYESTIQLLEKQKDLIENQITLLSSPLDYENLRLKQQSIINHLISERNALNNTLGTLDIPHNTEAWNNLYSQIMDINQEIQDARDAMKSIDSLQFDNIKETFEFDTSNLEHELQTIQDQIDLLEMKGLFANEKYYNSMISYTQQKLDNLQKEHTQLQNILNNSRYEKGVSEWNDMYTSLMEIDEEIASMTNNLTEFQNSIRDLNWEIFEYLEESLNRITDETDYLIELLSKKELYNSETGAPTEYASAALGLHAAAYDIYKQQAKDYFEEVLDLQSQLSNGAGKDVLEQYHAMQDAHRDAVLAAEEEKEAILDLIEEGYQAQLDALQSLIDKKKEQMQAEKNLYDYQKSIKQHTDTISSLEKQQLAYENDNSEEAMSKIQQIRTELEKAKEELAETEYEQYLSDTETMLEQLASDYEAWMNERLDHSDALLNDIIGQINTQGSAIMDTLNSVGAEYGTIISDSITSIFHSESPFTSALTNGFSNVTTGISGIAGTTSAINELLKKVADITGTIAANTNAGSNTSKNPSENNNNVVTPAPAPSAPVTKPVVQTSTNTNTSTSAAPVSGRSLLDKLLIDKYDGYPKSKLSINTSIVDRLKYNNKDSSWQARSIYWSRLFPEGGPYIGSASQNTRLLNYLKGNGYADGTSQVGRSGYYWTQENGCEIILRRRDGAILTPLSKGDAVLNKNATQNFYDMFNHPQLFKQRLDTGANAFDTLPNYLGSINDNRRQDVNVGDIHVTIDLPNVKNYSEFRNNLVRDKDFENSMCVMINNAMLGKSTIEKLKYCRG